VVHLTLGDLEGKMAMKIKLNERGQSVALFAILMPIMSLFLLGILDYMVTNARVCPVSELVGQESGKNKV